MRGYITYVKPKGIVCRTCKKPMEYWIPGLALEKHEHEKCLSKRLIEQMRTEASRIIRGEDRND